MLKRIIEWFKRPHITYRYERVTRIDIHGNRYNAYVKKYYFKK